MPPPIIIPVEMPGVAKATQEVGGLTTGLKGLETASRAATHAADGTSLAHKTMAQGAHAAAEAHDKASSAAHHAGLTHAELREVLKGAGREAVEMGKAMTSGFAAAGLAIGVVTEITKASLEEMTKEIEEAVQEVTELDKVLVEYQAHAQESADKIGGRGSSFADKNGGDMKALIAAGGKPEDAIAMARSTGMDLSQAIAGLTLGMQGGQSTEQAQQSMAAAHMLAQQGGHGKFDELAKLAAALKPEQIRGDTADIASNLLNQPAREKWEAGSAERMAKEQQANFQANAAGRVAAHQAWSDARDRAQAMGLAVPHEDDFIPTALVHSTFQNATGTNASDIRARQDRMDKSGIVSQINTTRTNTIERQIRDMGLISAGAIHSTQEDHADQAELAHPGSTAMMADLQKKMQELDRARLAEETENRATHEIMAGFNPFTGIPTTIRQGLRNLGLSESKEAAELRRAQGSLNAAGEAFQQALHLDGESIRALGEAVKQGAKEGTEGTREAYPR